MTKEQPEKFDEFLNEDGEWKKANGIPSKWKNVEYIKTCGDYHLYIAYEKDKEDGLLYRTKIENATEKKICEQCGQEIK
jgi:hypothetical protein